MRNLKDAVAAATALLEVNPDKTLTVSRSLLKTLTTHATKTLATKRKTEAQQDEIRRLEAKVRLLQEQLGGGRK